MELGDAESALDSFDELASQGFFRNIPDLAWLGGLTLMARHTAAVLSAEQASQVLAEIEPWAGLNSWVASASFGPVDIALGRLTLRIGQLDRADRYFADAAAMAERLTSPGFAARALLGRAEVALERGEAAAAKSAIVEAERLIDGRGVHGIETMVEATRNRLD